VITSRFDATKIILGTITDNSAKKFLAHHLTLFPSLTAVADPIKLNTMPPHGEQRRLGDFTVERFIDRQLQIDDHSALLAYEMIMRSCLGIEAVKGAAIVDPPDQALLDQDIQVPVHCPHAKVRILAL
jgi:hypothetical protein